MAFFYLDGTQWRASKHLPAPEYCIGDKGLLAFGGTYSATCFLDAYRQGVFPWPFSDDNHSLIPWFSPPLRFVLEPEDIHISHSLRRFLNHCPFDIRVDHAFDDVIGYCANMPRKDQNGTWITPGIRDTFCTLHRMGFAHSIEAYEQNHLCGGFYGLCIGHVFCAESMFTLTSNAAKSALALFAQHAAHFGIRLIDCQTESDHIKRFGAHHIPRNEYLRILRSGLDHPVPSDLWQQKDLRKFPWIFD